MRKAFRRLSLRRLRLRSRKEEKQSPFLSLPLEIREEIYTHYFGPRCIHIVDNEGHLSNFRCRWTEEFPSSDCCNRQEILRWPRNHRLYGQPGPGQPAEEPPQKLDTALFHLCKQVSEEAYEFVYRTITFKACSLKAWIDFAACVSPSYLAMIRSLYVYWPGLPCPPNKPAAYTDLPTYLKWEHKAVFENGQFVRFWDLLSTRMPKLRDLVFAMDFTAHYLCLDVTADWHRQFLKVTGLRHFELDIRLEYEDDGHEYDYMRRQQFEVLKRYLRERISPGTEA